MRMHNAQRTMHNLLLIVAVLLMAAVAAAAQTNDCPADKVCITRDAAIKMLQDQDDLKAVKAENATLKQAIADHKDVEANLKVELGKAIGELTGSQQMNVRQTAIIDVLLKNVRPKKIGLINF